MVAEYARDDLRLLRPALELPVVAGHLDVRVGGLSAAGGEIEPVDAGIGEPREALGEGDGVGVRAARISRGVAEIEHLGRRRVRELLAPVPAGVVPQPREPVDERIAVRVVEHRALAADPDPAVRVDGAAVQRMDQVASIPLDERGVYVVGHARVLFGFGRSWRRERRAALGRRGAVSPGGSRHGNGTRCRCATGSRPDQQLPLMSSRNGKFHRPHHPSVAHVHHRRRRARGVLARAPAELAACRQINGPSRLFGESGTGRSMARSGEGRACVPATSHLSCPRRRWIRDRVECVQWSARSPRGRDRARSPPPGSAGPHLATDPGGREGERGAERRSRAPGPGPPPRFSSPFIRSTRSP